MSDRDVAASIFGGIARQYSWMGAVLSLGQDVRWRRYMVGRLPEGGTVLDVAAGTGLVSRELIRSGAVGVVALDPSPEMTTVAMRETERVGVADRIAGVLGRAEQLPFGDETFDALTFTYLLRYVDDPAATLRELARVVRPGGVVASLEFHRPQAALLRTGWHAYTRFALPTMGRFVSKAWGDTGSFLGPSIDRFVDRAPLPTQVRWWHDAGLTRIRTRVMSLGAGVVISGERR